MIDFEFIQKKSGKWVISAPRRATRPDEAKGPTHCPFCPGQESVEREVYRVPASTDASQGGGGEPNDSNWQIRVVPNKYPFAPIHEVIIHSPDHHKNFGELEDERVELIFKTYRQRFQTHKEQGQVYIFNNRGEKAGESLPHPHSQLTVIPQNVKLDIPELDSSDYEDPKRRIETSQFYLFCPKTSEWPDETWVSPKPELRMKNEELRFGDASDEQISELSQIVTRLVQTFQKKYGAEFPYNFYISPKTDWYLRFIPRLKTLGGFEVGTNVSVNTQDPTETLQFLKENFI